jgi:hypothetical protein
MEAQWFSLSLKDLVEWNHGWSFWSKQQQKKCHRLESNQGFRNHNAGY